jgi:hypothetical protein
VCDCWGNIIWNCFYFLGLIHWFCLRTFHGRGWPVKDILQICVEIKSSKFHNIMLIFRQVAISCAVESVSVNWNAFWRIVGLILLWYPDCFLYSQNYGRSGNSIEFDKPLVGKRSFFLWFFIINWHLIISDVCTKLLNIFLGDRHPILGVHE